jgi:hypothetical protein
LFDGRQVKTDYDTFFINLTEFTGKAFKNMKINIEKEINDLKVGLNLSLLIYEVILHQVSFTVFLKQQIIK